MFVVPHSTLSRVLKNAEDALRQALSGFSPARIVWPTIARQDALARLTAQRESMLQFTWGLTGAYSNVYISRFKSLLTATSRTRIIMGGYTTYMLRALCVSVQTGLYWNDSDTGFAFREALRDPILNPDKRYGVVADSAFPCSDDMVGRILTPLKEGELGRVIPIVPEGAQEKSRAITSIRQTAEWGMGSVEKVYHRLLHPLPYDMDKRKLRLDNLFRLANFRVRMEEISQIRTTWVHGREDNM
ncbi:hypothetical protein PHMEG_00018239 [Phytophthora megakarya]|uniref:DDE Tnp4 domain-containing protein n=1 Tax=Phytophthora megakarya TaxID=4795 RepID=A0A225VVC1_9STRA|nr:hypothetical protein PHMEG_00018239 [Phytophthora megakarya]